MEHLAAIDLSRHAWHQIIFFVYVLIFVALLFRPPKSLQSGWLAHFLEAHFGDMVGLYVLHLGIGMVIVGSIWNYQQVSQLGYSLVLAGMAALKLKQLPPGSSPAPPAAAPAPPAAAPSPQQYGAPNAPEAAPPNSPPAAQQSLPREWKATH